MKSPANTTDAAASILAGGGCQHPIHRERIQNNEVQSLKIIIDGNQLMSHLAPDSLIGPNKAFLPHSQRFRLSRFTPKPNGQCELIYTTQ